MPAPLAALWQVRKGTRRAAQRVHLSMEHRQRGHREAGSYFAGKLRFLPTVITDEYRAEVLPRALRRSVTADDEFLLLHAFQFDPRMAPMARLVGGIALF